MNTTRNRTRFVTLAIAAAMLVAACGAGSGDPADGSLAAPVVVRVAGGGDQMAAPTAESAGDAGREVSILPFFGGWIFEVGEGLNPLPTNATGYHFATGNTVDAAEVARIAAALGVAGDPVALDPESGNVWRVGPDDGSAAALYVSADGMSSWYYSGPWSVVTGGGCVAIDLPAEDPDAPDDADAPDEEVRPIEECETPDPPAGVPSAAEAEEKARRLLGDLGEEAAAYQLETYADEWGASVFATTVVDGLRWPLGFGFSFGGDGVLQWANGLLGEAVATGPYPLIGLDEALERLTEQNGLWGFRGSEVAADVAVTDGDEAPPSDGGEEMPEPEPVVATLVSVAADLWWAWDADNSVWLLPAYTFTDAEGLTFTVPAVTDEYLVIVEPLVDPVPEPDEPDDDPAVPTGDLTDLQALAGTGLEEFEDLAARLGFETRVVRQDGEDLAVTEDYSESRVNVSVDAGVVVEVLSIG